MSFGLDVRVAALQAFIPKVADHPQIALALGFALDATKPEKDRLAAAQKAFEDILLLIQAPRTHQGTTTFSDLSQLFQRIAEVTASIESLPPPRPLVFEPVHDQDTLRSYLGRWGINRSMTDNVRESFKAAVGVAPETVLGYGVDGSGKEHRPSDILILPKVCEFIRSQQTDEEQAYGPRPDLLRMAILAMPKTLQPLKDTLIDNTALMELPSEFFNLRPDELLELTQEKLLNAFDERRHEEWLVSTESGEGVAKITAETLKAHAKGDRDLKRAAPKTREAVAGIVTPLGLAFLEVARLLPFVEMRVMGTDFHRTPAHQSSPVQLQIWDKGKKRVDETQVRSSAPDIHRFPLKDLMDIYQPLDDVLDEIEGRILALKTLPDAPPSKIALLSEEIGLDTALNRVSTLRRQVAVAKAKVSDYQDTEKRRGMPLNTPEKAATLVKRLISFAWDTRETAIYFKHEQPTTSGSIKYTVKTRDDWPDGTSLLEVLQDGISLYLPSRLFYFVSRSQANPRQLLRLHIAFSLAGSSLTENDILLLAQKLFPGQDIHALVATYKSLREDLRTESASVKYPLTSRINRQAYEARKERSARQKGHEHRPSSDDSPDKHPTPPEPDFEHAEKKDFPTKTISSLGPKLAQIFLEREAKSGVSPETIRDILRDLPAEWLTAKRPPDDDILRASIETRNAQRKLFLGKPLFEKSELPHMIDTLSDTLKRYILFLRSCRELFKKDQPASVPIQKIIEQIVTTSLCQEAPLDLYVCAKKALGEEAPVSELGKCVQEYEAWSASKTQYYEKSFHDFSEMLDLFQGETRNLIQREVIPELVAERVVRETWNIPIPNFPEKGTPQIPLIALAEGLFCSPEHDLTPEWKKIVDVVSAYPKERKPQMPERTFEAAAWLLPEAKDITQQITRLYENPPPKDKKLVIYESIEGAGVVGQLRIGIVDEIPTPLEFLDINGTTILAIQIHFLGAVRELRPDTLEILRTAEEDVSVLWSAFLQGLPESVETREALKKVLNGEISDVELRAFLNKTLLEKTPAKNQVLVGAIARTTLWPHDPLEQTPDHASIAYRELRELGSNFTVEEVSEKRMALRQALFSTETSAIRKAAEAFYDDLITYHATRWAPTHEETRRAFQECPEIFYYASAGTRHMTDPIAALWTQTCDIIPQLEGIKTKADLVDNQLSNATLLVAAQTPELRTGDKHHYKVIFDHFKSFRSSQPAITAILSLMFLSHFFYDVTHATAVHKILTAAKKPEQIRADLARYYHKYRDEIRHRLYTTRRPLAQWINKEEIPSAERPFGESLKPTKIFHNYDEVRAILSISDIFPGVGTIETAISQAFLRRLFFCRETHEAWGQAVEIIDYVRASGNQDPFRALTLISKKSPSALEMIEAVSQVYEDYRPQIDSSRLGMLTAHIIDELELHNTYKPLEEWDLTDLRRDWPDIITSIQEGECAVVTFRIGKDHNIQVKTLSAEAWKRQASASPQRADSDQFIVVANEDNRAPYTLAVSAQNPFIKMVSKALDCADASSRNPILDLIISWGLWGTLRVEDAYKLIESCSCLFTEMDRDPNDRPLSPEALQGLKRMSHVARRIKARYEILGERLFGGYFSNKAPETLEVHNPETLSIDTIPLALDKIERLAITDDEKSTLREFTGAARPSDELIGRINVLLHKAGQKIFSDEARLTQAWLDHLGIGSDIASMPELVLFDRRLTPILDGLNADVPAEDAAESQRYNQFWKKSYQSYALHHPIYKVSSACMFLLGLSGVLYEDDVLHIVKDLDTDHPSQGYFESEKQAYLAKLHRVLIMLYKKYRHEVLWRIYENEEARIKVDLRKPGAAAFPDTSNNPKLKDIGYSGYAVVRTHWKNFVSPKIALRNPKVIFLNDLFNLAESDSRFKPIFVFYFAEFQNQESRMPYPTDLPRPATPEIKRTRTLQELNGIIQRYAA